MNCAHRAPSRPPHPRGHGVFAPLLHSRTPALHTFASPSSSEPAAALGSAKPPRRVNLRRAGRQTRALSAMPSAQSRWDVLPSFSIDARRRPRPLPPMPPPPRLPPRLPASSPSSSAGAAGAGGLPTTALGLLPDGGAHDGACNGGEAAAAGVGAAVGAEVGAPRWAPTAATGGGSAGPSPAPLFLPPLRFPFRPCRREKKEAGRGA